MKVLDCRNISITALLAGFGLSVSISTLAQDAPADPQDGKLDEIVVTAQKRIQNIQDVGVAVTALGSSALRMVDTKDATQLAVVVPSLQVQQFSPSTSVYNIRGVSQNDFSDFQEGPIAFYNDEVYVSALGATSGQTFDLERIEVLRGPQGTLFGRNATGGLVQAITAKPTSAWQGYASLGAGRFEQITAEGAVGGPLSEHIRMRLSATADHHDGYFTNQFPGAGDGGDRRFYAGRAQFDFDVGDHGLLRVKAEYLRNDHENSGVVNGKATRTDADGLGVPLGPDENFYGTCPGCTAFGYRFGTNELVNNLNYPSIFDRELESLTVRYEQDLGFAALTSITNYQNLDKQISIDVDASPLHILEIGGGQGLRQFSQELRLAGKASQLNWVAGLYGLKIKTDVGFQNFIDPAVPEFENGVPIGAFAQSADYAARQKTQTAAVFAQVDYPLSDIFTIVAGGRYSADWKDYGFVHLTDGVVDYDFAGRRPDLGSQQFDNWSGKLQLEARVTPDALLYIGVNRGTKSGGFNAPRVIPQPFNFLDANFNIDFAAYNAALAAFDTLIVFDQEVLTNYEAGAKLTLADSRLTLNGSVFHYDYDGYQAFQNSNANVLIFNSTAALTGAELELTARPVPALSLSGFLSHMFEAKVKDITLPSGRVVDRKMPQAPDWSAGLTAAVHFPVGASGALTLATTWKYDSSQYFTVFNPSVDLEGDRIIGNVRASYAPSANLELALFVNNVTDERYRVFTSDNGSFISVTEDAWARPRWYGGSVTYRFGQ